MNTELGNLGEISRSRVQEFYWVEEVRENLSSLRFQKKKISKLLCQLNHEGFGN